MTYPEKKPKQRPLSIRERQFIKALIEGKTPTQAMRDAGYAESTALAKQCEKVGKLAPTIQALMDKGGLSDPELVKVIAENIHATKKIILKDELVDVPDPPTQHRFVETSLKLKGYLRDAAINIEVKPLVVFDE